MTAEDGLLAEIISTSEVHRSTGLGGGLPASFTLWEGCAGAAPPGQYDSCTPTSARRAAHRGGPRDSTMIEMLLGGLVGGQIFNIITGFSDARANNQSSASRRWQRERKRNGTTWPRLRHFETCMQPTLHHRHAEGGEAMMLWRHGDFRFRDRTGHGAPCTARGRKKKGKILNWRKKWGGKKKEIARERLGLGFTLAWRFLIPRP